MNEILTDLNDDYWPDLDKIPAVKKLLTTDYKAIVNCKEVLNAAKDNEKLEYVIHLEARKLVEMWLDEDFPPKLMQYMMSLQKAREAKPKI